MRRFRLTARMSEKGSQKRRPSRNVRRNTVGKNLPEEIWQKIAVHLTAKEWCRVSGTCKTTWRMSPETLRVYPKDVSEPEGMQWMATRWQATRTLYLHAPATNSLQCALAAMQMSPPTALTYLDMAWGKAEDAPTVSVLLTWLVARAERLDTLIFQAHMIHCLPPMVNLKHLVVNMSGSFTAGLAQSLPLLRALETLDLTAVGCEVPALDLQPLAHLRRLALFGTAPESLQLPADCKVYVEVYCQETAQLPLWEALHPALESWTWHEEDFVLEDNETLPEFLLGERCPPTVRLCLGEICASTAPLVLLGGLAHAERLCITGNSVNVHLPAHPSWKHIHLRAEHALDLTFDNVQSLAARMPTALFQWWTARGLGLLNLYKAFQLADTPWWYDVEDLTGAMWNSKHNREGLDLAEVCPCGACTPCLRGEEHKFHLSLLNNSMRPANLDECVC